MPDHQKQRAYRAEWLFTDLLDTPSDMITFMGSTLPIPAERRFGHFDHVVAYVQARWPGVRVQVKPRMHRRAHTRGNLISIPDPERGRWAWREAVILHEVAHYLAPGGHGPRWAGAYIDLVTEHMGDTAGWILSSLYHQHNVNHERGYAHV